MKIFTTTTETSLTQMEYSQTCNLFSSFTIPNGTQKLTNEIVVDVVKEVREMMVNRGLPQFPTDDEIISLIKSGTIKAVANVTGESVTEVGGQFPVDLGMLKNGNIPELDELEDYSSQELYEENTYFNEEPTITSIEYSLHVDLPCPDKFAPTELKIEEAV